MKNALLIVNPCSGRKKINKYLDDIIKIFEENGFNLKVLKTEKRKDATEFSLKYAKDMDLIVCAGGDGTFNEMVSGVLKSGINVPVGYIPCGSTNDFAKSLNLSTNILKAANDIVKGTIKEIDIGLFNDRLFTYVSSFGCFTSASYKAKQSVKNKIGHLAYILEGAKAVFNLKPTKIDISCNDETYSYDLLFGAISNSKSIAGLLTLDDRYVDMADGKFELLLVSMPKNFFELLAIVKDLKLQRVYKSKYIKFLSASSFKIGNALGVDWTLDGEYDEGSNEIVITNLNKAIRLITKK